jgi:hypothetical protein
MFNSEKNSVPFEALTGFQKPEQCDFSLVRKSTIFQGRVETEITLGYRKDDPNIYYHDHIIAGHYPLPQPLEKMDVNLFNKTFPATDKYIVNRMAFLRLWKLANNVYPIKK